MSWSAVAAASTTYSSLADVENGYVDFGYVENEYILGSAIWSAVAAASMTWS